MAIFVKIDFWGLKYPPEVLVELKTCSTIYGTHVHTILNHKDLTGSTVGVRNLLAGLVFRNPRNLSLIHI